MKFLFPCPLLTVTGHCSAMGISQPKKPPHFSIPIPPKAAPTTITSPQSLLFPWLTWKKLQKRVITICKYCDRIPNYCNSPTSKCLILAAFTIKLLHWSNKHVSQL